MCSRFVQFITIKINLLAIQYWIEFGLGYDMQYIVQANITKSNVTKVITVVLVSLYFHQGHLNY